MPWSTDSIGDLAGRTMLITGANSGIGFEASVELARAGAQVLMACRNLTKAEQSHAALLEQVPNAQAQIIELDLASLDSIQRCSEQLHEQFQVLHALINNAGVMAVPYRTTKDGFEMQIGTNHLGHFALTGQLLDLLVAAPESRVVNVSSLAHRMGRIHFDDLHSRIKYQRWPAYGQSKLANLLFTHELHRRLQEHHPTVAALACHPGYSATHLQAVGPEMDGSSWRKRIYELGNRLFAQDAATGALPTVRAATDPEARSGEYYGPGGWFEMWGPPIKVSSSQNSHNEADAKRLWKLSEDETGEAYLSE